MNFFEPLGHPFTQAGSGVDLHIGQSSHFFRLQIQ
jgi:hypothetical protein